MHTPIAFRRVALAVLVLLVGSTSLQAAPPWQALLPFKRVSVDPNKSYELEEGHGPWLIMCTSFAGPTAPKQAQDLVVALRREFGVQAYTFKQAFDFTQEEVGLGVNKYGGPKKMKPRNGAKFEEIAVLVGDYQTVDDPQLESMLKTIKYCRPVCMGKEPTKETSQRYAGLRQLYRAVSKDPAQKTKGPLGSAFVTRNPLLPEEYFVAKGLDPFIVDLNKDLEYSLLKNKGKYTVRVASFRGVDTMKPLEFEEKMGKTNGKYAKIDEAAIKASKLTAALREQGIEAYEFHDSTESIVCIGSFDEVGQPRADGKTEINPAVYRVMQAYGPVKEKLPGQSVAVLQPRMVQGIPFDPQPMPVEVPRQSIATAYNPSGLLR